MAARQRWEANPGAPCKFYSEGSCRNGDTCRFSHDGATPGPSAPRGKGGGGGGELSGYGESKAPQKWDASVGAPCKFYAETGHCKNGDTCRFAHDGVAAAQSRSGGEMSSYQGESKATSRQLWDATAGAACKFFAETGSCKNGDNCRFSHDEAATSSALANLDTHGTKRKSGDSAAREAYEEGKAKVRRTLGFYNLHGGLTQQIDHREALKSLDLLPVDQALIVLSGLKEKAESIQNPTNWIIKACAARGREPDEKVKKTLAWFNVNGNLPEQIHYDAVAGPLARLEVQSACKLLSGLHGEKGGPIRKPTEWILRAVSKKLEDGEAVDGGSLGQTQRTFAPRHAQLALTAPTAAPARKVIDLRGVPGVGKSTPKGGGKGKGGPPKFEGFLDQEVKGALGWWNADGGCKHLITYDVVAPFLSQFEPDSAVQLLGGLENRVGAIRDYNAWIITTCKSFGASAM